LSESPPQGSGPRESTPCLLCGNPSPEVLLVSEVQLAPATGERFTFVRCTLCDLVFLSPRPTAEGMGAYYPPSYLPHRGPEAWGRWRGQVEGSGRRLDRARLRWIRGRGGAESGCRILDVGCGRPTFLRLATEELGCTGVGLDVSDAGWREGAWGCLELVNGTVLGARSRLRGLAGPGFDVITMWHALEHEHDPRGTLEALLELAAPGASLVVEVPNLDSLTAWMHGPEWAGFHTPRHTAAYTPATLAALLTVSGWSVADRRSHGTLDPYVVWWLGRQIRRGRALEGSLEGAFPGFVLGKVAWLPLTLLQRWIPLGVQVATARAPGGDGPPPDPARPAPAT
jgi:2-polyprenyl-3-methyl-5-hydroxy-6-metoxy-1,4-benzoquinol methylase